MVLKMLNLTAFGMTKKSEHSAENDPMLASLINSKSSSVCLFGKSWDFQVDVALGITNEENLENISESAKHIVAQVKSLCLMQNIFLMDINLILIMH
jgi:2-isopropylmalate synthase